MKTLPKIFIAFDFDDLIPARALLDKLESSGCGIKIGKEMFTAFGPQWVSEVVRRGFPVFLDLKYHDIPNTVAKACLAAARLGVQIINVHASGGLPMMRAAQDALSTLKAPPLLIAVTVLTSFTPEDFAETGCVDPIASQVKRLALLTQKAGLGGVVCSAEEAPALRALCGPHFKLITPGIRLTAEKLRVKSIYSKPSDFRVGVEPQNNRSVHKVHEDFDDGEDNNLESLRVKSIDDQHRIMTPESAIQAGSDILVIGRPITQAPDPLAVVHEIQRRIQG